MQWLWRPFTDLLDQRSIASYSAATIFAFVMLVVARIVARRRVVRPKALMRFVFARSVFLHPSSLVDYRLYLVNLPVLAIIVGWVLVGSDFSHHAVQRAIGSLAVPVQGTGPATWPLLAVIALAQVMAMDFGYWLGHLAMHRNPVLWEFHKVHHSAEVMTFATEYRQHPIEFVVIPTCSVLTTGVMIAVTQFFFGQAASDQAQIGFAVILLGHILTFHHLRHSHVGLAFTGWAGRLFHSPAHHRVHHSANPAHFDTNLGYLFSLWDWMAGTLVMPVPGQRLALGIGAQGAEHDSVMHAYLRPFGHAWAIVVAPLRRYRDRAAVRG